MALRPRLVALLAACALIAPGCADAVDPTLGTEQVYSLYGYLDPTADRQVLRVVPITPTLGADSLGAVGAVMTSVEPATGRTAAWRDSLVTFADGTRGTLFLADYTPTAGTRVDLTVRAPDGREATASVEIPPLAAASVGPALPTIGSATYPVTVAGVPRVIGGTLRITVKGVPGTGDRATVITIPLDRPTIWSAGGAWTVEVPFLEATRTYLQDNGLFRIGLELLGAEYAPFVANEAWAVPPGGFDLDVIVEPGSFSNVAGGFGFVGAGYATPVSWVPSTNVQSLAGFTVTNDPGSLIAINEIGDGYVELFNPTEEAVELAGYEVTAAGPGGGVRIAAPGLIEARGFLVVDGPFSAAANVSVHLLTGSGRLLRVAFVEADADAWGAYPDGYSYKLPRGGPDLFYGPTVPSAGRPNRPRDVPAVINEVAGSGPGFVEVIKLQDEIGIPALATSGEGLANAAVTPTGSARFLLATEGGGLALSSLGGSVFLMFGTQVVDARFYGPQAPDQSEGYLPDGPDGTWTPALRRTPRTANAAPRLGH